MHRSLLIQGVRLHYVEQGRGPLVILLHGFPEHWLAWRHQLPALAKAGFRVVAPDLRGYNRSDQPQGVKAYRVEALVADVKGLIEGLGETSAVVVGHDWGGVVAWSLAMHEPDSVRRLIILNAPHPQRYLEELLSPGQLLRSWYVLFFQLPWLPELILRAFDFSGMRQRLREEPVIPDAFDAETIERHVEALQRPGALTAALNYYRAAFRAAITGQLRAPRVIDSPTLLIWGEQDRYLSARLIEGLEPWVTKLTALRLPEASHWIHAEYPERVNREMIAFLRGGEEKPS